MPFESKPPNYGGIFDFARMTADLQELEYQIGQPTFWNDSQAAGVGQPRKSDA